MSGRSGKKPRSAPGVPEPAEVVARRSRAQSRSEWELGARVAAELRGPEAAGAGGPAPGAAGAGGPAPGAAGAVAPNPRELFGDNNFWGKHLRADYRHDGLEPTRPYNFGGTGQDAKENIGDNRTKEFGEHTFWDWATAQALRRDDPDFKARMNAKIEFKIPMTTGEFKPLPMLDALGNESIGIVMDAGLNITKELGAKNVITFGMCLDSALSPVDRDTNPIYCDPADKRPLYIDLAEFGFDPAVIEGIWIAEVVDGGRGVKTAWKMPAGLYDPMNPGAPRPDAIEAVTPALGVKTINLLGGDYRGRRGAGGDNEKIGKTLGDTMIVASAMERFFDGSPNPFHAGIWKKLGGDADGVERPQLLVVKTGDILNAVRAIFKKVPVILERYRMDSSFYEFEFYPGVVDPARIATRIPESYGKIITIARARYDSLIAQFNASLEGGVLKSGHTRFVGDDTRVGISGEPQRRLAGDLFVRISEALTILRDIVVRHFEDRRRNMEGRVGAIAETIAQREEGAGGQQEGPPVRRTVVGPGERDTFKRIISDYNADLEHLKNLCPQTDSTGRLRDATTKLFNPIIPITRVGPAGFPVADGVIYDMEIRLITAFRQIVEGPGGGGAIDYSNTPFKQHFFDRMPGPAPVDRPEAPPPDAYAAELEGYVQDIVALRPEGATGGQRGGMDGMPAAAGAGAAAAGGDDTVMREFTDDGRENIPANSIPFITKFIDYYQTVVGDVEDKSSILNALFNLVKMRNSNRIVSPDTLEEIRKEFIYLKIAGIVNYPGDDIPIDTPVPDVSTVITCTYNAFVMSINRGYSTMHRGEQDADIGFGYLEEQFKNYAYQVAPPRVREELGRATPPSAETQTGSFSGTPERDSAPRPSSLLTPAKNFMRAGDDVGTESFEKLGDLAKALKTLRKIWTRVNALGIPMESKALGPPVAPGTVVARDVPGIASGGDRTPRRKNRKSTYRLKKKPSK